MANGREGWDIQLHTAAGEMEDPGQHLEEGQGQDTGHGGLQPGVLEEQYSATSRSSSNEGLPDGPDHLQGICPVGGGCDADTAGL